MTHTLNLIQFKNVSLEFPNKVCFTDFSAQINHSDKIAIIGRNGSGKSSLLKMLQGIISPTYGEIKIAKLAAIGYVPQIIEGDSEYKQLSGGQRINKALSKALSRSPNILLLDEPTNHLDQTNRKSLIRMLHSYQGALVIVSHDVELLSNINKLWHIENSNIIEFSGNYNDYIGEIQLQRSSIEQQLVKLKQERQDLHKDLMQEQHRAAKSKIKGQKSIEQRKWPTIVSKAKFSRSQETSGHQKLQLKNKKEILTEQLSNLNLPKIILPKFHLSTASTGDLVLVSINSGILKYQCKENPVLEQINLLIRSKERIAIHGNNGSGKTTLLKAILSEPSIIRLGDWQVPKIEDLAYLDQHYGTLDPQKTVFETIYELVSNWGSNAIRQHLNDFLFSKTEQVERVVATLSEGEKARLSLAQIAAKTPKLLILDEIANNLDLEMRYHVMQILKIYPGAMIIVSHDQKFLDYIGITKNYYL